MGRNPDQQHIIKDFDETAFTDHRRFALELIEEVLRDLSPERMVQKHADHLFSGLPNGNIHVFGFGKAAGRMMAGIDASLGERVTEATIIVPVDDDVSDISKRTTVLRGTHPYTSKTSVESSKKLVEKIDQVPNGDIIIFLISGGGSALFEIPEDGFSIEDISQISKCMMQNGADISQLNCVRNSLSSVKGGKLISHVQGRKVVALYVSDVPYDELSLIASGPLVPGKHPCDPETTIHKFPCNELVGQRVLEPVERIDSNAIENVLLLKNYDFVHELCSSIRTQGEHVIDLGSNLSGDVQAFADSIKTLVRAFYGLTGKGFWFVGGGEPTVMVSGKGKGGRCQEFALRFTKCMQKGEHFLLLTAGTDGVDGSSEAMGAIVDDATRERLDDSTIDQYIENSDSFTLLNSCKSSLISGRTGNNVSDIFLGYYGGMEQR